MIDQQLQIDICREVLDGAKQIDLARKYGITMRQVSYIICKHGMGRNRMKKGKRADYKRYSVTIERRLSHYLFGRNRSAVINEALREYIRSHKLANLLKEGEQ